MVSSKLFRASTPSRYSTLFIPSSLLINDSRYAPVVNVTAFNAFEIDWLVVSSSAVVDHREIALKSRTFGIFKINPGRKWYFPVGGMIDPR